MVEGDAEVELGSFVAVPFGKNEVRGVVWDLSPPEIELGKIKPVIKIENHIAPMQKNLRDFVDWVAKYSCFPKGSVLAMCMSVKDAFKEDAPKIGVILGDKVALSLVKMTEARTEIIDFVKDKPNKTITEIIAALGVSRAVIKGLIDKNVLLEVEIAPENSGSDGASFKEISLKKNELNFSVEQQKAVDILKNKVASQKYSVSVLDGVTGSGKTEVYFEAVRKALEQGQQALVLLPEIVLTTQLIERFERHLGISPTLWHSNLTLKQRRENWIAINNGSAKLLVGARSALFLPFQELGVIIVDEEHESAFKQEEGVMYHGRDMAIVRAKFEDVPCILVSATPSIETCLNLEVGKFEHIHLTERFGDAVLPAIQAIDMRQEKLEAKYFLSEPLRAALFENFEAKEQSLLFLNRRGYAPLTLCRKCGYRFQCDDCSAWLVEHRFRDRKSGTEKAFLQCHHCGITKSIPKECPECESEDNFAACGPGVQRLEEEVKEFLPDAVVTIMTSDLVGNVKESEQALSDINSGKTDIIIGTQMVAKGHHFPNLTLVGIVDADMGLEGGDLRAAERSYQLLHQVSGRAGRASKKGKVLIQSYMPENAVISAMLSGDRDKFIKSEIERRRNADMPPFIRLASIILAGKDEGAVKNAANEIVRSAPNLQGVRILGPAPAIIYMLRGNYRYRILVSASRNINIQKLVEKILGNCKLPSSVRVKVDIDPYSFM